ncbi:MAG: hypothetical protein QOG84_2120 [Sphingomonadales bacterium]|jgi:hypothetical protein|nr:hypothetical protein [Sphingomonadales bacterium]
MGAKLGKRGRWAVGAAALAVAAVTAFACADPGYSPTWELAKDRYELGGNAAVLTPGNDTRVNLLLLLADRRGTPVRDPSAQQEGPPLVLFPWSTMSDYARPPQPGGDIQPASRCQSQAAGAAAFAAALKANPQVPADDRQRLAAARAAYVADCSGAAAPPPAPAAASPAGKAFAAYLAGAGQFYSGRFATARASFAGLAAAPDPWLRETALYMVARTELNRAQQAAFDEYGSLTEVGKRDLGAIAAAGAALDAYLKAYPNGRYAASARGLTRRVAWLGGKDQALAAAFDRQLAGSGPFDGAGDAVDLDEEIDLTLLTGGGGFAARDPLLLAVADLQAMRCTDGEETPAPGCTRHLTRDALERQAPLFAHEPALFGYLRATEAFYVRRQPREVLALIPDAAREKRFTYLEFSRQVLRGLALDSAGDRNARGFWLSLFDGAVQPYQREALELALALHEERSGAVARIFAPDSRVRHPVIRQMLLEDVAGPDLLRQQAKDVRAPRQEREVAAYVLLAKELRRGFYREFLDDVALVPAGARADSYYGGARSYNANENPELAPPPLGRFGPKARLGEIGCPALVATVRQLVAAPAAVRPRLCLAEYFRSNGFDGFETDETPATTGLASSRPQFPGQPYQRLEVYKAVIADPAASADDKAIALNRAIRCYAPSGGNSCGGTEVGREQRRAWFNRLKHDYPASRWAQQLKFYW